MQALAVYLLIPLMSVLLVLAQAFWGSFIKTSQPLKGSPPQVLERFITSPKVWIGAALYILAIAVYFILLSKYKFFAVQVVMAALAILFSTLLSYFIFHEKISPLNFLGMGLMLSGIVLVFTN